MRVAFLSPRAATDVFFGTMAAFMRRAADELDIDLEVVEGHPDRNALRQRARELLSRAVPPDYLLLVNEQGLAVDVLPRANAQGIKVLLVNQGLLAPDVQQLGEPRRGLKHWLGELVPDDQQAGRLLAKGLIAAAMDRPRRSPGGRIGMCGVGGAFTGAALMRISGLRQAVREAADVTLEAVAPAHWDRQQAREATAGMLARFPDTEVIWSASDLMALGAAEAIEAAGMKPGVDIALGGIDWAPLAFEQIRKGTFTCSVGGHFLDGAWALVMLYDYHHGHDFGPVTVRSTFTLADRDSAPLFEPLFSDRGDRPLGFARLSKARNPGVAAYDFTLEAVLG